MARGLRCVFQRLEGETTREGVWLSSTAEGNPGDKFCVRATALGRLVARPSRLRVKRASSPRSDPGDETSPELTEEDACATPEVALPRSGTVAINGKSVRFARPRLMEEYTVSMDGVRQDFIIEQRPLPAGQAGVGPGPLRVELAVAGAKVEPLAHGALLVPEDSGRMIAYSRLRVTDATGKELTARMEVASGILPNVEGAHPAARNLATRCIPCASTRFSQRSWMARAISTSAAVSALSAACLPRTLPNGTGPIGRPWAWE